MMKPEHIAPEAFLAVYEELSEPLFRHAFFRVGDRDQALDIVQTAFTKAWQYLAKGKEVDNMRALLYAIVNNLIVDGYRKAKMTSLDAIIDSEQFDVADGLESERTVAAAELRIVLDAIAGLSENDRQMITLRFIEGLSPTEIAESTGLSENVVSVRINRAVKRLKKITNHD